MTDATPDADALRRQLDHTERRLRATHAVARIIGDRSGSEDTLPKVLGALGSALGARVGSVWAPQGEELVARATWSADAERLAAWDASCKRVRFAAGRGLPGQIWKGRGPWHGGLAGDDDADADRHALLDAAGVTTGIGFPVTASGEIIGVIELFLAREEAADDTMIEVLRTIGAQLGQFLEQTRVRAELEAELDQRQRMTRASELFGSTLDAEGVMRELARATVPWLGDWAFVLTVDADGSWTQAALEHGDPAAASPVRDVIAGIQPSSRFVAGGVTALREKTSQWRADVDDAFLRTVTTDPEMLAALQASGVRSYAVAPVIARGTPIGALYVFTEGTRVLTAANVKTIEELVARASLAVANARMYASAQSTAIELDQERDALSKLNDIGRRINAELDTEKLVSAVTDVATQLTGAQFGAFFHNASDRKGEIYALSSVSGLSVEDFDRLSAPYKTSLFAPSFDARAAIRIADITLDPRGKPRLATDAPMTLRSYLAVPVVARSGTLIGALLFGHTRADVFTERSERIAVGLAAHAATAMENARLYGDAQRLIAELEKTNSELDLFAYAASHDLRAPLRGISNLAQWIEEDLGKSIPKKVNEHLQMLKGRANRMDKLITGLLELARVGRSRQKPERVDVTELLHDTIDLLSPSPKSRVLIIGAMPTMVAERFGLQQVFMNLIGNALQHSQRPDVVVKITCIDRPEEVEFGVADNGVGIAPEHHERVWEMFQTLQSRDLVESTGIGLAIVRKQVEANGGQAWLEPAVSTGATVRFTWPKRVK